MKINVRQRDNGWMVDYRDPQTGKRIRKAIPARNAAEARKIADAIHAKIVGEAYGPDKPAPAPHTIFDAIEESIIHTATNSHTRGNYRSQARQIAYWFGQFYPTITLWRQVTLEMLRQFFEWSKAGVGHSTLSMRLYIVRATSRHMAAMHGCPDVATLLKVSIRRNPMEERETAQRKILTPYQVRAMLHVLREIRPDAYAVCSLQALAGLRVTEALYLTRDDVSPLNHTVTIRDNDWHETKNTHSSRIIPVIPAVIEAIQYAQAKIWTVRGLLFQTTRENPWTATAWSPRMREWFDKIVEKTGDQAFNGYHPRWLRAAFSNAVLSEGVDRDTVKRYMGHAPEDTLGRHYQVADPETLAAVPAAIERWRNGQKRETRQTL